MKFAVVDLETTGGLSQRDRITEVGIVIVENGAIVETFQSLVNPERSIPPQITRITGITNEMVQDAPKFFEIAKDIVLMTKSCVFVAHNVGFDYGFLQHEFNRLGFTYSRRKLCTVKLSKRLYPSLKSHGLSNLIKVFDLPMSSRHRALDDAKATAYFLKGIIEKNGSENIRDIINYGLKATQLPDAISMDRLHQLPETHGVYFFEDSEGRYLYIGKSNNIQKRVIQHFRKVSKKSQKILQSVHSIKYETTPGELIALLKEDEYIKTHQPPINKAQRKASFPYVISKQISFEGRSNYTVQKLSLKEQSEHNVLANFHSKQAAYGRLIALSDDLSICKCQLLGQEQKSCWKKQIGLCRTQEINEEQYDELDARLNQYFDKDMFVIEEIKHAQTTGFIKIENGVCTGYGMIEANETITNPYQLDEYIIPYTGSSYSNRIIFRELSKKKAWRIIEI